MQFLSLTDKVSEQYNAIMVHITTLSNKDDAELIEGAVMHPYKVNMDESGILVESLRTDWKDVFDENKPFAMQYYSVTQSGVARDEAVWHFHPGGQQDRFFVVSGSIVVAVADYKNGSKTEGVLNLFLMNSDKDPYMLLIPKLSLHTYMVVSKTPATLLNFPTKLYDPDQEVRIPFNEARITVDGKTAFSWDLVRNELGLSTT